MTLKEYYDSLPASTSPKTSFLEEISTICGVKEVTVRTWVKGRATPINPEHRELIARATGLSEAELFGQKQEKQ